MDINKLNDVFYADNEKGVVIFKSDYKRRKKGEVISSLSGEGKYKLIRFEGELISLHRLIWILNKGYIPSDHVIDHINGDCRDNRLANLRVCTHAENMRNRKINANNSCGYKGVYFDDSKGARNKWRAQIRVSGSKINLGRYSSPEEAHGAYKKAALLHFGEYAKY